ncbi:dihydrofolate reductase family protein [Shimazuella kribbensis]|uniref:dihydrofolate reductase family protein n=1 Tax=Shimazuella kribbensis TaxID=139808 RepID=UPI0003F7D9F3|nr:dihydrofolate reductase family protein [Shimazuella kribbensis]
MAKLIYAANISLDGYIEDERSNIEWTISDDETYAFWTDFQLTIGTYLYGCRMYESMVYWETANANGDQSEVMREFAQIWRAAEKIVYSRTLQSVSSAKTRIEREFDPDAIRRLKESSGADITIGGPELAGRAMSADLIDECHLLLILSSWVEVSEHCRTTSACGSSCSVSAASKAALFISTTA